MFDYEKTAGQVFLKDRYNRLQSYTWTNTGISLTIPGIDRNFDLGKYEGDVEKGREYKTQAVEIKQIFG